MCGFSQGFRYHRDIKQRYDFTFLIFVCVFFIYGSSHLKIEVTKKGEENFVEQFMCTIWVLQLNYVNNQILVWIKAELKD